MIGSTHHITLGGIDYKLAQSEEGEHYMKAAETLRPPNAVTVQGEGSNQKFQVRPDVLLWHWTDWSGGEGANKYKFLEPSRSNQLNAVRAFSKPGNITPGYYVEDTQLHTAGGDLAKSVILVKGISSLYALDTNALDAWIWNPGNAVWDDQTISGATVGAEGQACGDDSAIYYVERATRKLWSMPTGGAATEIFDGGAHTDTQYCAELGAYVYVFSPKDGEIEEVLKSGASSTTLASTGIVGDTPSGGGIVEMNGKIYFMVADTERTRIHEVVPSTSAGEGYVSVLATMEGFQGESLWAHGGTLYFIGNDNSTAGASRSILYVTPGGDWGALGAVRQDDLLGAVVGVSGSSRMLDHFFVARQSSAASTDDALFQIDALSGGFGQLATNADGDSNTERPNSLQVFDADIFWSTVYNAGTKRIMRAYAGGYQKLSNVISPWHDFDLAETKILSSIILSMKALPADWTVYVDYAVDGSTSWTTLITDAVDGSVGGRTAASTAASTKNFRRARFRIRMVYGGAGIPTTYPEVYGIEIRSQLAKPLDAWVLLLDLNDEKGAGASSHNGAQKISNIETAAANEAVLAFYDGYKDRLTGNFAAAVDVVIDSYRLILGRPGEGYVQVRLVSVA